MVLHDAVEHGVLRLAAGIATYFSGGLSEIHFAAGY
jgi:hypothetical protein